MPPWGFWLLPVTAVAALLGVLAYAAVTLRSTRLSLGRLTRRVVADDEQEGVRELLAWLEGKSTDEFNRILAEAWNGGDEGANA